MKKLIFIALLCVASFSGKTQEISQLPLPIYKFMQEWLEVPYKWAGRTKKGIDCSGLTSIFFKEVYNLKIDPSASSQWSSTKRVKRDSLRPGNLVFFYSTYSPSKWHVGVYLGNDAFLHAPRRGDSVKISLLSGTPYGRSFRGGGAAVFSK